MRYLYNHANYKMKTKKLCLLENNMINIFIIFQNKSCRKKIQKKDDILKITRKMKNEE